MTKHLIIVGKKFSGLVEALERCGYSYTLLQDRHATKFPGKKMKYRVVTSFEDMTSVLSAINSLSPPIDGVVVIYENYVLAASTIARHLGLRYLSETAARACTDKELMRQAFAKAPEKISPDFQVIHNENDLRTFAAHHHFPLILKPANLSKSLLVTKSNNLTELIANYRKTMQYIDSIYKKYAPNRQPKLIIEEYLEGPIFSVDAFIDAHGEPYVLENVVDYQTGYDVGYDDNFHYSRLLPSRLAQKDIEAIRHTAAVGCKALGMTSSPAHIEIILTQDGPRIVEIGARNGGYRERMHALANGIDITANALALALDQPLDITPKRNDSVGVFELFPKSQGIFNGIKNEGVLKKLPSFHYLSVKSKPGQFVGKAGDGYKMCAVVILHNRDKHQFAKDVAYLNKSVSVITEQ